jgi:fluoride exporter
MTQQIAGEETTSSLSVANLLCDQDLTTHHTSRPQNERQLMSHPKSQASHSISKETPYFNSRLDIDTQQLYQNINHVSEQNGNEPPVRWNETIEGREHGSARAQGAGDIKEGRQGRTEEVSTAATARAARVLRRRPSVPRINWEVPDTFANLDELAVSPVQNPDEEPVYRYHSLEDTRSREQEARRRSLSGDGSRHVPRKQQADGAETRAAKVPWLATQIYTLSYLVLFSILGTLARLGLQALTTYPGAPVSFGILWANFAGSMFMGFLAEDRMLFRSGWGTGGHNEEIVKTGRDEESGSSADAATVNLAAARKAHLATKKTIPLYIGLATGFCGSFTSFSSFIRDVYLALSNDLPTPGITSPVPRNGGYSFMALLAVTITTVSLSLSALFAGAHFAITIEPFTLSLPFVFTGKVLDRVVVVLGWGVWLGAVLISIFPPHDSWRGTATFALVFAPLGCLARFYTSLYLNGRIASFPLGTFVVNVAGTAILGMCWDLAHVPLGGVVGCQVLQGVEDGFCGCLTTVSTWVAELAALRRRHAYVYGGSSVIVSLALLIAIMGGLRWSTGFAELICTQ